MTHGVRTPGRDSRRVPNTGLSSHHEGLYLAGDAPSMPGAVSPRSLTCAATTGRRRMPAKAAIGAVLAVREAPAMSPCRILPFGYT